MKINKSRKHHAIKIVYTTLGIALLLLVAYGLIAYSKSLWPFDNANPQSSNDNQTKTINTVNYDAPTDKEVQDSQLGKKNAPNNSGTDESAQKNIAVGVSYAGITNDRKDRVEIRAFTPSIVEGDGTCTATLKKDQYVVSESSEAFIDSTTSQCQPIYIPVSRFATTGNWSLVVSYKSPTGTGNSESVEVSI